jgi:hypothetical protein
MNFWDYLIIAMVISCLTASIYYTRRAKKRGCGTCCDSSCPVRKSGPEGYHILRGDENDEDSGGCGKLS